MTSDDAATPDPLATPEEGAGADAAGDESSSSASGMKVVRGTPDDNELAALVAGMAAYASAADADDDEPGSPTSAWMDRVRTMRGRGGSGPLGRGASAWRHSLR